MNDETGSVRWLCFELTDKINFDYKQKVDINDVWRQAYKLYQDGFAYQLTLEEVAENDVINKQFLINTPEMDLIPKLFKPASKESHDVFCTATDILNEIAMQNPNIKCTPLFVGKALKTLGFIRGSQYNESTKQSIKGYFVYRV